MGLCIFISVDDHRGVRTREFSADVVYATEQEADIHGIASANASLMEGGRPVRHGHEDNRSPETLRLRVQFRTTFSASSKLKGWAHA